MAYVPINIDEAIRREGNRRRFSPRTTEAYQNCVKKFLYTAGKTIDKVSKKDIREYLEDLADRGMAGSTLNVNLQALKFFFCSILNKKMKLYIKYSKESKKLPVVLSKEEIRKLLDAINNEKHRFMISFFYSCGLRVSELINLKVKDIEIEKGFGFVRKGKGGKDRIFVISKIAQEKLGNLIEMEKLEKENFIFLTNRREKYSVRSLQEIVKRACSEAGINKKVGCHTLRHSFATHLIQNGYSVGDVQIMLGHKSPETSMIYVHMASPTILNIKSPLDSL